MRNSATPQAGDDTLSTIPAVVIMALLNQQKHTHTHYSLALTHVYCLFLSISVNHQALTNQSYSWNNSKMIQAIFSVLAVLKQVYSHLLLS